MLLRHAEDDGDGAHLRDADDAVGVGLLDDVALVDGADAGSPVDRRNDSGVGEIGARAVDGGLVGLQLRLELRDGGTLRVGLLLGDGVRLGQPRIALQVALGILQQRLVLGLLGEGLVELRLVGGGVDLGEDIAFLDLLPILNISFWSCPSTCGRTVTAAAGRAVPTPSI